jgi:hypothetical protein
MCLYQPYALFFNIERDNATLTVEPEKSRGMKQGLYPGDIPEYSHTCYLNAPLIYL